MTNDYFPDVWEIVKFSNGKETFYKILAGWYGGYTFGDSWKLSSGIISIKETDDRYEIGNASGSTYFCNKDSRKLSGMTSTILKSIKNNFDAAENSLQVEIFEGELSSIRIEQ